MILQACRLVSVDFGSIVHFKTELLLKEQQYSDPTTRRFALSSQLSSWHRCHPPYGARAAARAAAAAVDEDLH